MRILLAIGLVSVAVIVLWGVVTSIPVMLSGASVDVGPASIDTGIFYRVIAMAVPVMGLVWMIRIFRGPRDEPPPWRHRDR
jgi:hypothetical protein